jgi:hypothetical protein
MYSTVRKVVCEALEEQNKIFNFYAPNREIPYAQQMAFSA